MTKEAFIYAAVRVNIPEGKRLWIHGDTTYASGDVYTPYQDHFTALKQKNRNVFNDINTLAVHYDAIGINCQKQQEETEGLIALALKRSRSFVMAVAANDAGGGRLAKIFASYGVETHQLSKNRCRIVWTYDAAKADRTLINKHLALLEPQQLMLEGRQWWTVPGLFGWNKIDVGSKLLVEHLPSDLAGIAADFGCGFGYLSAHLADYCPLIASIDAYDVDKRAVAITTQNNSTKVHAIWQDMRAFAAKPFYDVVVMNPPFHNGKEEDIGLGEMFIRQAWASLRFRGQLFMVANRNLPYEKIVPELKILYAGQGYKIMMGRKA